MADKGTGAGTDGPSAEGANPVISANPIQESKDELAELQKQITAASNNLGKLKEDLKALEGLLPRLAPKRGLGSILASGFNLVVTILTFVVAIWALVVARDQLTSAAEAIQSQTAYTLQSSVLDTYGRLVDAGSDQNKIKAALLTFDAQIGIANRLPTSGKAAILNASFWKDYSGPICTAWKSAICKPSAYADEEKKRYPGLVSTCVEPTVSGKDDLCAAGQ
ncbi:hypothetical protein EHI45_00750 [Rhizobium leguminosarum]|uniref:hypothetical protein n=1 Tax=Rhizobium leguminosarum TaxID=384 RepID=UPI000FEC2CF7|nr:hypothetical protein [Rhizobium leguminosarum]RWX19204.1 hypothetical protein EHI45_00750 [Rhizobium leguminosarum]